uniref:Uncharacterized protein n=1 Tax=Guillardia theta TaxID=55529 RepID=A0A7S4M050_GUITH|mmetsp:Transcript_11068/g.37605  ORF Transcript_11068/g.37605 Transcript_11068/m.37605 type:complete len:110 (+) Transcript_11068:120-449(+)
MEEMKEGRRRRRMGRKGKHPILLQSYYTKDNRYIVNVSRLQDQLRLHHAEEGELSCCYRIRDRRPREGLQAFTRTCRPDPFNPYRFLVLVDDWHVPEENDALSSRGAIA